MQVDRRFGTWHGSKYDDELMETRWLGGATVRPNGHQPMNDWILADSRSDQRPGDFLGNHVQGDAGIVVLSIQQLIVRMNVITRFAC